MKKFISIGEALIDFIPNIKGEKLKNVDGFKRVAGGAPSNVAGAVAKLGGNSIVLTKLGNDSFGDYIVDTLNECNINTEYIKRTDEFDTSLAFVSLTNDGDREFKFYRKTAADLQYSEDDIPENILENTGIIHFCSVDLVESPMKNAHKKLIRMAKDKNVLVSFDPNLRFMLWDDKDELRKTVNEFIKYADILKISDDELEFITGKNDIKDALPELFSFGCSMVIYTLGADGAKLYLKDSFMKKYIKAGGYKVDVVDTTGAGDSFIGAFLYRILKSEHDINDILYDDLKEYLDFSNLYAASVTTKPGALASMVSIDELEILKDKINDTDNKTEIVYI